MHGNGCFTMHDGSEYIGCFENGYQHGEGMITTTDGTEMYGKWHYGVYQEISYKIELHDNEDY